MRTPELRRYAYNDAFSMGCNWPTGLKLGDGSTDFCDNNAICRIVFETEGVAFLCHEHEKALTEKHVKATREQVEP